MPTWKLYHRLTDPACAEVRRWIVDNNFEDRLQFRNIDASEKAKADLVAKLGHEQIPTLETETGLYTGKENVLGFLNSRTTR